MILDYGYRAVRRLFGFDWGGGSEAAQAPVTVPVAITAIFHTAGSQNAIFHTVGTQSAIFRTSGSVTVTFGDDT